MARTLPEEVYIASHPDPMTAKKVSDGVNVANASAILLMPERRQVCKPVWGNE